MDRWIEQDLGGWGRYPVVRTRCTRPERRSEVLAALADRGGDPVLAHGLGRSYADTALLRDGKVVLTERLDRMLDFDPIGGWVRCEAGVSLKELIEVFLPRGWFPQVVPGTWFVTVGGAIGNDIHGKGHHTDGTFCDHVRNVEVLTASGEVVVCDAEHEPELFWATVGGLGLTGVILSAEVRMRRVAGPWIEAENVRVESLDHFFDVSADSGGFSHVVTWIDCVKRGRHMGRGILTRGRHAAPGVEGTPGALGSVAAALGPLLDVPVDAPGWLVNPLTMRAFNEAFFRKERKGVTPGVMHFEPFYFPLDFVGSWNRMYGKAGFLQYQFVVPPDPEHRAVRAALDEITRAGMASFLAVIKEFGDTVHPYLSFPRPGVTLALDFPNRGQRLLDLCDRLDQLVLDAGGRVYLGKDARLPKDRFRRMYPEWEAWKAIRDKWDPSRVFQSEQGRRLGLCE